MSTGTAEAQGEASWATDARAPGLAERLAEVTKHFPTALSVDDFMSRVEVALAGYGFTGDNVIGEQRQHCDPKRSKRTEPNRKLGRYALGY